VFWKDNLRGDTIGEENMCTVEWRAKRPGVHSGIARTVTETATTHATVLCFSELARTRAIVGLKETAKYFNKF